MTGQGVSFRKVREALFLFAQEAVEYRDEAIEIATIGCCPFGGHFPVTQNQVIHYRGQEAFQRFMDHLSL